MKKIIIFVMFIAIGSLCFTGCKKEAEAATKEEKPAFDLAAAKSAIEARSKIYVDALNKRDSVGLANCYTTDAKFMQPNGEAIVGKQNIQKLFSQWLKEEWPTFSIETIEVWGNESVLAAEENWFMKDKDGKLVDSGKALEVYKMEDGVWKLHRDCYNSNTALPKK
ncbi:YybH family protein [Flavobacterium pedocola]